MTTITITSILADAVEVVTAFWVPISAAIGLSLGVAFAGRVKRWMTRR